jgi:phi13 family phage major tail protein
MPIIPIGVKGFRYAELLTDPAGGTPTYGTVYPIPALKAAVYTTNASLSRAYGDDGLQAAAETVGAQTLAIDLLEIPQDDKNRLLGLDYAAGILQSKATNLSPYVAVGFEVTRDDGSSDYVWFPKVKFQKPGQDAQTKAETITYQSEMLEGAVVNLTANNVYRVMARTNDPNVSATTITNWFNAPVTSSGADLGALNVTVAKLTTQARWTFTKTGGGNIILTQSNLNTNTLPVYKNSSGAPIAGAYVIGNNGTATVTVTFTPTVAFGAVPVSASVVAGQVFDQNGVRAPATGAVWTSD